MIRALFVFLLLVNTSPAQVTEFVNPFIGTSNGGNTFPGSVLAIAYPGSFTQLKYF